MELLFPLENSKDIFMIDFDIYLENNIVDGLNFQICYSIDGIIDYNNSLVINEDLFSLIQEDFSRCYYDDKDKYQFYHWGHNFHNKQDIVNISLRLKNRISSIKEDKIKDLNSEEFEFEGNNFIKDLNYYWLSDDQVVFLEKNKIDFILSINKVIEFINNSCAKDYDGIYVIGV